MFGADDRGQSVQIGAVLLFGVLVLGLSVFQATVVPSENGVVEFNGYADATADLLDLRSAFLAAGTGGSSPTVRVATGVRYPARAVLINPDPPTGSLATTASENVTVAGVVAVSGEVATVRGFWDTDARGPRNYSTRDVVFAPAYNEIDVPSVAITGEGAYRLTPNGPLSLAGPTMVAGDRITIVTVDGDLDAVGLATAVAVSPASVATRSVTITGVDDADFTVTLPVPGDGGVASATRWNRSRAAEAIRSNPRVRGTWVNGSRVDVVFDGTRRYELRLARVVVRETAGAAVETATEPQYVVAVDGNGSAVPATGTRRVAVEVRDRYNNPVGGVAVSFSTADGSFASTENGTASVVTGSDGRAAVFVDPNRSSVAVAASFEGGTVPYNATTLTLTEPSGGLDEINGETNGVALTGATAEGNSKTAANVTFTNDVTTDDVTAVRVAFHSPDDTNKNAGPADRVTVAGETFVVGDRQEFVPGVELDAGSDALVFDFDFPSSGQKIEGDFFIVTLEFGNGGEATYFVSVDS